MRSEQCPARMATSDDTMNSNLLNNMPKGLLDLIVGFIKGSECGHVCNVLGRNASETAVFCCGWCRRFKKLDTMEIVGRHRMYTGAKRRLPAWRTELLCTNGWKGCRKLHEAFLAKLRRHNRLWVRECKKKPGELLPPDNTDEEDKDEDED